MHGACARRLPALNGSGTAQKFEPGLPHASVRLTAGKDSAAIRRNARRRVQFPEHLTGTFRKPPIATGTPIACLNSCHPAREQRVKLGGFMKRRLIAWSVVGLAVLATRGYAQARYDSKAETVVQGTVQSVLSAASTDGVVGVHLEVATPSGVVRVALGPAMFIAGNNYYFIVDDQVSVVGAKVGRGGEVWARTISKAGTTALVLRDEDGTPRWGRATDDDPDGCGVSHAPIR
jgi:hypothetical protein